MPRETIEITVDRPSTGTKSGKTMPREIIDIIVDKPRPGSAGEPRP